MTEMGVPGYEAVGWFAYFAPANTPREIVMRLNGVINGEMARPEVAERLSAQGTAYLAGGSPEQLDRLVKSEMAKWGEVVRRAGVKAN